MFSGAAFSCSPREGQGVICPGVVLHESVISCLCPPTICFTSGAAFRDGEKDAKVYLGCLHLLAEGISLSVFLL
jgi:hypothetical protein